jgi:hypothetical protein
MNCLEKDGCIFEEAAMGNDGQQSFSKKKLKA